MEGYSNSLFRYASKEDKENKSNNNSQISEDEDFESPPIKTRNVYSEVEVQKKINKKELVKYVPQEEDANSTSSREMKGFNPPITMSNIMQTYRENPVGMFVGATLTNCTININMPK